MIRVCIGMLVLASCGWVQAAPLVYFTLEGRTFGSSDPFSSNVAVQLGDALEYRLRARLAAEGQFNEHLDLDVDDFRPGKHGLNSLSISITQDVAEPIQVDLSSPVEFAGSPSDWDSWGWEWSPGHGSRARPGTPSVRQGSPLSDLLNIRPQHGPGVFSVQDEETIFTGVLTVAAISGESGQITAQWGPVAGGGWFHGRVFFPTPNRESGPDPLAHFSPLILTAGDLASIPEPSSIALAGAVLVGLALLRRKSRHVAAKASQ